MKRAFFFPVHLVLVLFLSALAGPIASAGEITFKINNPVVETRQESKYLDAFSQRVAEKSKGAVELKNFHGGSLGVKDADILRLLADGFVDGSIVYAGYLHRDAPELFNAYADGAISRPEEHAKAVPAILDTYKKTLEKWKIEYVGSIQSPLYDTCLFCKEPVQNLEQLKGKKVRVWSKQQVEALKKLEVAGQIIPQADMYMALQTGVVDCAIYLAAVAPLMHLQEVAPNETYLLPYASIPNALGFSRKAWAKLSGEQQKVVLEAGDYIGRKSLEEATSNALDEEKRKKEIQARVEKGFNKLPDFPMEDRRRFVAKSVEAWADLAEAAGPEAKASRQKTMEAIAR